MQPYKRFWSMKIQKRFFFSTWPRFIINLEVSGFISCMIQNILFFNTMLPNADVR